MLQILRTFYFHSLFMLDWRNITKTKTINKLFLRLRATENTNSHPCIVEIQWHWSCLKSTVPCLTFTERLWPPQNKCSRFRLVLRVNHSGLKPLGVFLSGELSRVNYNSVTWVEFGHDDSWNTDIWTAFHPRALARPLFTPFLAILRKSLRLEERAALTNWERKWENSGLIPRSSVPVG